MRASLARLLADLHALPGAVRVRAAAREVRIGVLSELSGTDVCGDGDLVAGVLARFSGRFEQVGLFAMEPESAYELVRSQLSGGEPLDAYRALGGELVGAAARAVDAEGATQEGDATLQEDSVIGTLLRTHAASDAAVVAFRIDLTWGDVEVSRSAYVCLLADSKPFALALAAA